MRIRWSGTASLSPVDPLELNLNHLRHFHAIAVEGSLKAAGSRVGVAPSTLSEQMRLLEATLDQPLFDRSGGRLRLNEAGRRVHEHTTAMLHTVQGIVHAFDLTTPAQRPVLAIGVSSSVSNAFTARYFVPLFERDDLHVVIRQGHHQGLLHDLMEHELDLLLSEDAPASPADKGLRVRTLSRPALVAVVAPGLTVEMQAPWPHNLRGARFVNYTAHSSYRWQVDDFLDRHGIEGKLVGEVDDLGVIRATAEQGICVAFLPESVIGPVQGEGLVELGRLPPPDGGVTAIYRYYKPPEPVLEAIETLLDNPHALERTDDEPPGPLPSDADEEPAA